MNNSNDNSSNGNQGVNRTEVIQKKTSQKKIDSNRRNASRSTGPKSAEGRKAASRNALKHGMLSVADVVIRDLEDPAEYEALLEQLRQELRPVGMLEEMEVRNIANCHWRLRRVARCEAGEIRIARDHAIYGSFSKQRAEGAKNLMDRVFSRDGALEEVSTEVAAKLQLAEKCIRQIETGELAEKSKALLRAAFKADEELQRLLVEDDSRLEDGEDPREIEVERIFALCAILKGKASFFKQCIQAAEGGETFNLDANVDAASLPSKEAMERFLRYEKTITNQRYRAMNQLERLQQRRQGENVPPPINIDNPGTE